MNVETNKSLMQNINNLKQKRLLYRKILKNIGKNIESLRGKSKFN